MIDAGPRALEAWIEAAALTDGYLFRSVSASSRMAMVGGHSLRAGFLTTAFEHGADAFCIMDQTGHQEPKTLKIYDRRSKFEKHAGSKFL